MKIDTYTKVILTVIAAALVLNLAKGVVATPAMADTKKFATVPLNPDGSINVKFAKGDIMNVDIVNVDDDAYYHVSPIHVKVDN